MAEQQIPVEELTPEQVEALGQLDDMVASLGKSFRKMRDACRASIRTGESALAHGREKVAEVVSLQEQLESKRETPEYTYASNTLTIARRMFEGSVRMLEIQLTYDKRNMATAEQGLEMLQSAANNPNIWVQLNESGQLSEAYKFSLPLEDPRYLEARAQVNLYFGLHHWMACVDGIDAVLRATVKDTAVECQDPEEEQGRAKMAKAIQLAMAEDRQFTMFVAQLGAQLQEAWTYMVWAGKGLKGIAEHPPESKRQYLLEPEWKKLNGKAVFLGGLIRKVQEYPELAQFFPEPQEPEIPFEQLEWQDDLVAPGSQPLGTGRLSTGRLPGSGQLKK